MTEVDVHPLLRIALTEFADVVADAYSPDLNQIRVVLVDGSFVDAWFSLKLEGRYSYHWERLALDGTIYRHDNAPHRRWQGVSTFPRHFHDGCEANVVESHVSDDPHAALREFLSFVRRKLQRGSRSGATID